MSHLSERQRVIIRALCDTFVPVRDPATDGSGPPLHARVERFIATLPDPNDVTRLKLLLTALDSAVVNLALSGRPRSFAAITQEQRVAALHGWAGSRIQHRRAGFQALKRLVLVPYYVWPVDGTVSHPAWTAAGYPGPLPMPEQVGGKLSTVDVTADTTLECDVVVVGSGAGGGVAAGVLAVAGRSVVVLEKGENLGPADFTQIEGDMMQSSFLDGGTLMTQSASLPILAGSCLGGGTVINWGASFALRQQQREEWARRSGLPWFTDARFDDSLRRVQQRLGVNTDNSVPGVRDQLFEQGLRALNWHVEVNPRNARNCHHGLECGYCGYGCRHGAKQSTALTYLADAAAAGARIVVRCTVDRVLREGGRAAGVVGTVRTADGRLVRLTVRARRVVAAAGAIHTPGLLHRSGLDHPMLGRKLHLHPVTGITAYFPNPVNPWNGDLETRHSAQFADQDGAGYGAMFETGPIHWALPSSAFGWDGPAQHAADVSRLGHLSVVGILLRDRDAGRVVTGRDGRPRVHYELSRYDAGHLRNAMVGAARVLAAAGATEVLSLQQPPVRVTPGRDGWLEAFSRGVDARGVDRCRMALISFHQMGTCAMGADPARGVIDETGEAWDLPGLYVADASAFVTSSGVNPMLTIMTVADHVARGMVGT